MDKISKIIGVQVIRLIHSTHCMQFSSMLVLVSCKELIVPQILEILLILYQKQLLLLIYQLFPYILYCSFFLDLLQLDLLWLTWMLLFLLRLHGLKDGLYISVLSFHQLDLLFNKSKMHQISLIQLLMMICCQEFLIS